MSLIRSLTDRITRHRQRQQTEGRQTFAGSPAEQAPVGITESWRRRIDQPAPNTDRSDSRQYEPTPSQTTPHDHPEPGSALEAVSPEVIFQYLVLRLWSAFFHSFADDEHNFERQRYFAEAEAVNQRVIQLQRRTPGPELCCDMLSLLVKWQEERAEEAKQRVQELKQQAQEFEHKLQAGELSAAAALDEVNIIRHHLQAFFDAQDVEVDVGANPPSQLVGMVLEELQQQTDSDRHRRTRTGIKLFNWRNRTGN